MVPRVQKLDAEDVDIDTAFGTSPLQSRNLDFEFGYQGERARGRNRMCRVLIYLSLLVLVSTACAWAAYQYAWHSYWAVHIPGEDVYKPIEDHILYIGIMSQPGNSKERFNLRKEWVDEARRYYGERIKIEFLIGQVPIQKNLRQGDVVASTSEKKMERDLQDEEKIYGDISRTPAIEANNLFQTDQALWLFRNAISWKARFVMQTKDNRQIDMKTVVSVLEQRTPIEPPMYFGTDYDPDPEPEADGKAIQFFRRECLGISGYLAYNIVKTHLPHTLAFTAYGSSNMAANVASWVQYENNLRIQANVAPVMHLELPNICHRISIPETPTVDPCTPA